MFPPEWFETLGSGSIVAVLDSGYQSKVHLPITWNKNFSTREMDSLAGHGTIMCEIIASRDPIAEGVAPHCDLAVAKVWDGLPAVWSRYEQALDWALEIGADVVNMSFAVREMSDGVKDRLRLLDEQGVICVAAHSPGGWPGKSPHVVACCPAGALTHRGVVSVSGTNVWDVAKRYSGTPTPSVATAIISGVAACAKASDRHFNRSSFLAAMSV